MRTPAISHVRWPQRCRSAWRQVLGSLVITLCTAVPTAAIELQRLFDCQPVDPGGSCLLEGPNLSADGMCVAYTHADATPPYWETFPRIFFWGECAPVDYVTLPSNGHRWPAWSPTGRSFAYVAEGDAATAGIWFVAVGDLGNPPSSLRHVVASTDARRPAWSPDGTALAYETNAGVYTITVNLPNGIPQLVVPDGGSPSWGPNGQIVFVRGGDLWIHGSDGSQHPLTQTAYYEHDPAWSPQGTWIAYVVNQGGTRDLWVIAASGGTPVRVTSSPALEEHPSWSAGGDRLAFSAIENDTYSIWLATDLPDWTIGIQSRSWGEVKHLYR